MSVAVGFRAHTGWAAVVVLSGPVDLPVVRSRPRVELAEGIDPPAVYHHAREVGIERGAPFVEAAERAAARQAGQFLDGLGEVMAVGMVLGGSGRPLPALEAILPVHALLHAAEGALYRDAVVAAANERSIPVIGVPEKDVWAQAAADLGMTEAALTERVVDMGRTVGRPWAADQKLATLVAWMALASTTPPQE